MFGAHIFILADIGLHQASSMVIGPIVSINLPTWEVYCCIIELSWWACHQGMLFLHIILLVGALLGLIRQIKPLREDIYWCDDQSFDHHLDLDHYLFLRILLDLLMDEVGSWCILMFGKAFLLSWSFDFYLYWWLEDFTLLVSCKCPFHGLFLILLLV